MGIWVRSQNKEKLINVNVHLCVDYAEYDMDDETELKSAKYGIWGDNAILGIYSTKEKALNVLDMIEEFIKNMYIGLANYMGKPFQMPQDDEVLENE